MLELKPNETWQQAVERRLDEIAERKLGVSDLPLGDLQRRLETHWQPNGAVLLQAKSVGEGVLTPLDQVFPASFTADWVDYATSTPDPLQTACSSYRNPYGEVVVQGLAIRQNVGFAFPTTILTLPPAHRPPTKHGFACYSVDNAAQQSIWNVIVYENGDIVGYRGAGLASGGVGSFVYLDGIRFRI